MQDSVYLITKYTLFIQTTTQCKTLFILSIFRFRSSRQLYIRYTMFPAAVIVVACCTIVVLFLYKYTTSTYKYWKTKSVTFATPVPLFGNIKDHVMLKMTQGECLKNIYKYVYSTLYNAQAQPL